MDTTQVQSERNKWLLEGIASERTRINKRLEFLNEQERELRASVGQATRGRGNGKGKETRGRTITAEQRQKMADAAKKRWADHRAKKGQETQTAEVPPAVE